jgi:Protein of unknown function (DUF3485)
MTRAGLPLVVFGVLVLAAGALHGSFTGRWHTSAELENAVARLDSVPLQIGAWKCDERQMLDEADLRRGGIKGHFSGRYKNKLTGEAVSLLIVCGRPGPISVHTPDVCYGGAGYRAVEAQKQKDLSFKGGGSLSVWAIPFKAPAALSSSNIEVSWVWNGGDGWKAPTNPRWTFASYPALYKLYVVRDLPALASEKKKDAKEKKENDASKSFLQTFLPELETVLAPKS